MHKFLFLFFFLVCSNVIAQEGKTKWIGTASYYHPKFNGRKTTNGETFSNEKLTAANNFLKLGTKVKVTNLKNNKSVIVTINDRMHARNKRLIDVSAAAAKQLGFFNQGLCKVSIKIISAHKKGNNESDMLTDSSAVSN